MKTKKFRSFTVSIKNKIYIIISCSFIFCLILFSNTNLTSAREGLFLWANSVVPTLFPFFVATEILNHTNFVPVLGKYLNKFMRPIFKVPGEGAYAFLMGMISGYPVGAKIVCQLREKELCTKNEGERMLAFTNNSGPLFIIGTVGISLFHSFNIGILLLTTHILACITVGILFGFFSNRESMASNRYKAYRNNKREKSIQEKTIGEILGESIKNAVSTILMIGGFVVIFSIIISILNNSHILKFIAKIFVPITTNCGIPTEFIEPMLAGLIELTNGVKLISDVCSLNLGTSIIIAAFLLGFGGISILLQVASIVAKTDLSMKKYTIGKFLQGIIASFYVWIAIKIFPNFELEKISNIFSSLNIKNAIIMFLVFSIIIWFAIKQKKVTIHSSPKV